MSLTSTDVVNEALMLIGGNMPAVTGTAPTFDSSPAGQAAAQLYDLSVATVARQFSWDFSRKTAALVPSGNTAPFPWALEYVYPANGIQVWQLAPAVLADANNPVPINWSVGNATVSGTQAKVIWSNLTGALAIYNNNPVPGTWDGLFHQAVVRLLANGLAMALDGKPDLAQSMVETGGAFESLGEQRRG